MGTETGKKVKKTKSDITVSDKVKSYAHDPFVLRKANESKSFLEKHGFPKQLVKR